jgi:hypothetical protein
MKTTFIVFSLVLLLPFNVSADRDNEYRGNYRSHRHHSNSWVAPAIIGGVIAGSAIYGASQNRESIDDDNKYYRRQLTRQEIREEQLRQREIELERREHELYERQSRMRGGYDEDNCKEYYRDDGRSSYYSRNCW